MERKMTRVWGLSLAAILSLLAWFLRRQQLAAGTNGTLLAVLSLAVVVAWAIFSRCLQLRTSYRAGNGRSMEQLIVGGLAGVLALVSGLMQLANGDHPVVAVGSLAVAFCWLGTVYLRQTDRPVSIWLYTIPTLCFAITLVLEFRHWGGDPKIMHYCYELLSLIFTMFAVFHMGSFCFEQGKRRTTVFSCLCGMFFLSAALNDLQGGRWLLQLATILWLAVNAWQLLREK